MKKYVVFGGMLVEVKDDKFMGYPIEGIARLNNRIPYDVMVNVVCGGEMDIYRQRVYINQSGKANGKCLQSTSMKKTP